MKTIAALLVLLAACSAEARPAKAQPVVYNNPKNLVISGKQFSNPSGDCLQLNNPVNVTIIDSDFSQCFAVAIRITGGNGVTIGTWGHPNTFSHFGGGVYAVTSKLIKTEFNDFRDVHKDWGDPSRGQFVQYDKVSGPGNTIRSNTGGNVVGSNPEDLINLFESNGTAASPIDVSENCLENELGAATSGSGSGILYGDGGGSYQHIHSNILINPGQVGGGQAGGTNMQADYNRVYGAQDTETNVGWYIWNQGAGQCSGWIGRNSIDFTRSDGVANPAWDAGNCQGTSWDPMWTSNDLSATLSGLHCPAFNGH